MAGSPTKTDHPTGEELDAFLLGRLEPPEFRAVLRHLARGCGDCGERIAPLLEGLFYPRGLEADLSEAEERSYEFPLRRAIAAFSRRVRREAQESGAAPAPLPTVRELLADLVPAPPLRGKEAWAACEALLAESWELRREDPEGMVDLATTAMGLAEVIDPALRGPRALADLQCRALAALGNARRAADEPWLAEEDFASALQSFDRGTRDPLLLAHLMELAVSLFREQQRFEEAEKMSRWAAGLYLQHAEKHAAGRVLVLRGAAALRAGRPQEALLIAFQSLELLELSRDPDVTLKAIHNLACAYADCGEFEEADTVLWQARPLYASHGGPFDRLRLTWLEGRIAAGQGHHGRAERNFRAVRDGFLAHNLLYTAAVAALDLGILLLQRGRTAEARAVVLETVETFTFLHIEREATGAIVLLTEAARQDRLTITILKTAATALAKIQR